MGPDDNFQALHHFFAVHSQHSEGRSLQEEVVLLDHTERVEHCQSHPDKSRLYWRIDIHIRPERLEVEAGPVDMSHNLRNND